MEEKKGIEQVTFSTFRCACALFLISKTTCTITIEQNEFLYWDVLHCIAKLLFSAS